MSFNLGMVKHMLCLYSGILFSHKEEWNNSCYNMDKSKIFDLD